MRNKTTNKRFSWGVLLAFMALFTLVPIISTVGTVFGVPVEQFAEELKLANQQIVREIGAPAGVAPDGPGEDLVAIDGPRISVTRVQGYRTDLGFAEVVARYEALLASGDRPAGGWSALPGQEGRAEFCLGPRTLVLEPAAGGFTLRLAWLSGAGDAACP